jgi:aspartate-semialdehyde dehydrogenase
MSSNPSSAMDFHNFTSNNRNFPKKRCGASSLLKFYNLTNAKLGVLGATGSVGQRFILLLALHPHLDLQAVGASERSAGKKYKDAVRWKQAHPMTDRIGELVVRLCKTEDFQDCDLIFSGLDSDGSSLSRVPIKKRLTGCSGW